MRKYLLIALNVIALLGISSMAFAAGATLDAAALDRKSTRLNSSHPRYLVCRLLLEKSKSHC